MFEGVVGDELVEDIYLYKNCRKRGKSIPPPGL